MTHSTNDQTRLFSQFARQCAIIQKNVNQQRPLSALFWQPALVDGLGVFKKTQTYKRWVEWQQRAGNTYILDSLLCGFI